MAYYLVACLYGSVASTREFADGGGEAAANADGVALRAADHAVEGVGNEEHGIVAGLHEAALLHVATDTAVGIHPERNGGGEVGELGAVFLETGIGFLGREEQHDGTAPGFERGTLLLQIVQHVVAWFVVGTQKPHHVVAAPGGGKERTKAANGWVEETVFTIERTDDLHGGFVRAHHQRFGAVGACGQWEHGEACQHGAVGQTRTGGEKVVAGMNRSLAAEGALPRVGLGIVLQHGTAVLQAAEGEMMVVGRIFHVLPGRVV